jgi:hypothetical protein
MKWYALVFLPENKTLTKPEYLDRVTVSKRNAAQAAQGLTCIRWIEVDVSPPPEDINLSEALEVMAEAGMTVIVFD